MKGPGPVLLKGICAVSLVAFFGCCAMISPVSSDPVKKDKEISQAVVEEVHTPEISSRIEIPDSKKEIPREMLNYSVTSFSISKKKNGVLILLDYEGDDPKKNISSFFSGDNYFNISFYKGSFKDKILDHIYNRSIVGSVKLFKFEDTIQITMRFRENYRSSYIETKNGKISISVF